MDEATRTMITLGVIIGIVVVAVIAWAISAQRKVDEQKNSRLNSAPKKPKGDYTPKNYSGVPTSAPRTSSGGTDYLKSKGLTQDMVYEMHSRQYQKQGQNEVFFPKELGGLSFAKRFDPYKICIITTERPDFRKIKLGENVLLSPEPTNPYDSNAIVITSKTQKLGYIYRNGFQDMLNDMFREGSVLVGAVVEKEAKSDTIMIEIALYK